MTIDTLEAIKKSAEYSQEPRVAPPPRLIEVYTKTDSVKFEIWEAEWEYHLYINGVFVITIGGHGKVDCDWKCFEAFMNRLMAHGFERGVINKELVDIPENVMV